MIFEHKSNITVFLQEMLMSNRTTAAGTPDIRQDPDASRHNLATPEHQYQQMYKCHQVKKQEKQYLLFMTIY